MKQDETQGFEKRIKVTLTKDWRNWKKGDTINVRKPIYDLIVKEGCLDEEVKKVAPKTEKKKENL